MIDRDGGLVHPTLQKWGDVAETQGGMTMRQWYKGQAAAGFMSRSTTTDGHAVAGACAIIADALLAEDAEHGG